LKKLEAGFGAGFGTRSDKGRKKNKVVPDARDLLPNKGSGGTPKALFYFII
jgi:hypothetical protein